ncbi:MULTISPECIES: sterol desaturase family protein [Croceibacter]|uniref:Probable transmembrane protein n=1 Tax=Croceibacter atlanticus (strain ATCC BAA-628 / JCM 21780 / CIP 108009 / IAM 15332 / KCTC 12090 / HTCC2559) TaxID=216432 RepID=A3UA87_CROAH|nr:MULTISPECIES: sterol desaturase family protein [Croceibacter]EAP86723.1 probable transmembrane protein [Croceibacter atlanticus HTCC2559]MAO26038.1 sterol desaturase family protein [Roseovarius sp.]MBG25106.1 sterol desaturase family protein [Croceibacter sp.]MBW4970841.1 sterol desaturase family protein [Croceibacter atlanticus]
MNKYVEIIKESFLGYYNYLIQEISNPSWTNYLYWLLGVSLVVFLLEIIVPWRKKQPVIRNGFWLDAFYILFNFFLFSLIGYNALSNVGVELFADIIGIWGWENIVAINVDTLPVWTQLLIMFFIADFVQWNVHRMLHRIPWLWKFHKVHHSVKQMGFAAQFRFHFMETIVYKTIQYLPLAMIGFGIEQFFVVHMFTVFIGHLNHANLDWSYGKLGYVFNNPRMHIWHHSKALPKEHPYGMNYGLRLSLWDYLFGTAYVPKSGRDIEIGFHNDNDFPKTFSSQIIYPFKKQQ